MEQDKKTIMNFETIQDFNDVLGVETLHPLVSVIDMSKCKPMHPMRHNIHKHVIDATKELLADTSKTITDVSYQIGFQYPQHMSRLFKKETGMTPAQYRKQITA